MYAKDGKSFLLVEPVPPLQNLILNECKELDTSQYCDFIAVVEKLTKLEILSLNGVRLSSD